MFPRKAGREPGNETSFVESQRQWGTQREHYAPIMFQYEPPRNRTSPIPGPWLHNGRLVIDYWLRPLQNFENIPQVLSSAYEGEFIEPAQRQNKRIQHVDIRQRMYDFFPYLSVNHHYFFNACSFFRPSLPLSIFLACRTLS